MKKGKKICETLKGIRRDIAVANEIDYSPTECTHEGDCAGTCPKCESETRWLERQLRSRHALGKAVTIAGLSVALSAMSSCSDSKNKEQLQGYIVPDDTIIYDTDSLMNAENKDKAAIADYPPLSQSEKDSIRNLGKGCDEDDVLEGAVIDTPEDDEP